MSDVVVLVPSLREEQRGRVEQNILDTAPDVRVLFLGAEYPSYATAINGGYAVTDEPYLFAAADDLHFHRGWLETAMEKMVDPIRVVGTNDLGNGYVMAGDHATHYLVDRRYLDEVGGDFTAGPGSFMPDCYDHNWTDTEFITVARLRGVFMPALESYVEHLHPVFGKGTRDAVYDRGDRSVHADEAIYRGRMAEFLASINKKPEEVFIP